MSDVVPLEGNSLGWARSGGTMHDTVVYTLTCDTNVTENGQVGQGPCYLKVLKT